MPPPTIRPARVDEYDEVARVWMDSWASTGLEDASNFLLAKLRARVPMEIEKGWSLYVADDEGKLAAIVPRGAAEAVLAAMRTHPAGREAAIVGEVTSEPAGSVILSTVFGGDRIVDMLAGEQLPRIC